MSSTVMPAAFIGHGSPRITFEDNLITRTWRAFAASIPRPRAVLCISAHWNINASALTAMARPRTIHDFYYAPDDLYAFEYPAPGDPGLVEEMIDLVAPTWLGPDVDSWGFDHGCWSVLAHLYPEADVPVVQLAINASLPFQAHVDLGAQLDELRHCSVLVIGSGNIIHNGAVAGEQARGSDGFERSIGFDRAVAEVLSSNPASAAELEGHPDFRLAAPTDDHFVPLLYLAGLASASGSVPVRMIDGPAIGANGMSAYRLD